MALVPLTGVGAAGQFSLTALSTLATIVGTIPANANYLWIETSVQNTRYTVSGTAPTAAQGLRLIAGQPNAGVWLTRAQFTTFQAIAESAGAVLQWQFYKT
jgi:hypothetical protein